jgi:hypothetical protein
MHTVRELVFAIFVVYVGENIWKNLCLLEFAVITWRPSLYLLGSLDEFLISTLHCSSSKYDFLVWKSLLEGRREMKKIFVGPRITAKKTSYTVQCTLYKLIRNHLKS